MTLDNPYEPSANDSEIRVDDEGVDEHTPYLPSSPRTCFGIAVLLVPLVALVDSIIHLIVQPGEAGTAIQVLQVAVIWIGGVFFWIRGFRLWSYSRPMLSPTLYAILTLPIWLLVSAILTFPIRLLI